MSTALAIVLGIVIGIVIATVSIIVFEIKKDYALGDKVKDFGLSEEEKLDAFTLRVKQREQTLLDKVKKVAQNIGRDLHLRK